MSDDITTSGEIAEVAEAAPASASPAAQTTTDETAQPAKTASAVVDEHGPIPFERHEAILGKTRRDYDERISRLSWAEGLTREEVERALALDRLYRTQPDRLASHLSERVKASAEPQPDVKDERGELFYSPQQAAKWATWQAQKEVAALRAEMEERYGPIESEFTQARQMRSLTAQVDAASQWPGFSESITEITDAVKTGMTLHEAYISVVAPKLASKSAESEAEIRKKVLQELNDTTERVTDGVNPARVPAGSRKKESEMTDEELWAHVNQSAAAR